MNPTSLIIGDPHFKILQKGLDNNDFNEFIAKVTDIAKRKNPSFIVILGDILNSHETVKVQAHKLAESLIENMSEIAPTYILIGNHDYINNSQFLTNNHIFTPFKKWKNVFIADTVPLVLELDTKTFIFCPYTPPGRFTEALDKVIPLGHDWSFADCIFAHQEFKGCNLGSVVSTKGDEWDSDYPPVISGHIHEESTVGDNIFYVGTPMQQTFAESINKKVWFIEWKEGHDDQAFVIEKIPIAMKHKKCLDMSVTELLEKEKSKNFNATLKKYNLKINVCGTSDELKAFRRSKFANVLKSEYKVLIVYSVTISESQNEEDVHTCNIADGKSGIATSYRDIFHKNICKLTESAKDEYRLIFDRDIEDEKVNDQTKDTEEPYEIIELVFEENENV